MPAPPSHHCTRDALQIAHHGIVPSQYHCSMQPTTRIPLTLQPIPGGGYAVQSPALPALITEGDTEGDALENAWDALLALLDGYDQLGRPLPFGLPVVPQRTAVEFDVLTPA